MVNQLDTLEGCRSRHIRDAVDLYLRNDMSAMSCNVDYIHHLEGEVDFLRTTFMFAAKVKLSLFQRIITRLKG